MPAISGICFGEKPRSVPAISVICFGGKPRSVHAIAGSASGVRRGRDSNPRYIAVHKLSKLARSATLTPLRVFFCPKNVNWSAKVVYFIEIPAVFESQPKSICINEYENSDSFLDSHHPLSNLPIHPSINLPIHQLANLPTCQFVYLCTSKNNLN